MGRKQDIEKLQREGKAYREGIGDIRTRDIPLFQKDVLGYRQRLGGLSEQLKSDYGKMKNVLYPMITDESKRGISKKALTGIRGRATGALAGARTSALENIDRRVAALGMGKTGLGLRTAKDYDKDFARQQREAQRDVDIMAEEAKRSDLWGAMNTLGTALGDEYMQERGIMRLEQGALGLNLSAVDRMMQTYDMQKRGLDPEYNIMELKHKPGFWKTLGQDLLRTGIEGFGTGFGKWAYGKLPWFKKKGVEDFQGG